MRSSTACIGAVIPVSDVAIGRRSADDESRALAHLVREAPNQVEIEADSTQPGLDVWPSTADHCRPPDIAGDIDCLNVDALGLMLPNGRQLLNRVSFTARPGSLTAIIGPSGAGKSTLARLVAGITHPSTGRVRFGGRDLHTEYASLRHRIGLVPQNDVVHQQLTIAAALRYAAELRLPRDSKEARSAAVRRVLAELELTSHADTRIDKLSGGQRKRASVALELLTGPCLLILDEPTTGLDPALDRQVMTMLRRLADAGRIVLVVTHCLTYLDNCDQVVLLTPGGRTAYCGPPREIGRVMGTTDWADLFTRVVADPDAAHREFVTRAGVEVVEAGRPGQLATASAAPPRCRLLQQVSTVARRQARLLVADRCYFAFLTVLPFILGALSLAVPGEAGLGAANPRGEGPNEAAQIVMLLNISAVFMGTALTIRDLVGERTIFRREQAAGLSASAYLCAKTGVYCLTAAAQTAVLAAIVVVGKGAPTRGAVVVGNPIIELYLTLAATAAVAAVMGLAMSATAKSQDQILPMLVMSVMLSMVFSGGLIPVSGRALLDQVSWAIPARWGFAASASTTDLRAIAPLMPQHEQLWSHDIGWWLFDMTLLTASGIVLAGYLRWRIRLTAASRNLNRTARRRWLESLRPCLRTLRRAAADAECDDGTCL